MAAVADALAFEHKYTSGVIAWAPEDAPTDDQIGEVLDEFERTAWAGLEPDRYAWAAVLHRERGGASTSRRPAGRRPSVRCATPSTPNTAGAGRRSGAGQGAATRIPRLHRGGRGCGPGSGSNPPPAT